MLNEYFYIFNNTVKIKRENGGRSQNRAAKLANFFGTLDIAIKNKAYIYRSTCYGFQDTETSDEYRKILLAKQAPSPKLPKKILQPL